MSIQAARIKQIDKAIDAIRGELCRLEQIDKFSAASWQRAWDRHPDLRDRETSLFRERGVAQLRSTPRAGA